VALPFFLRQPLGCRQARPGFLQARPLHAGRIGLPLQAGLTRRVVSRRILQARDTLLGDDLAADALGGRM
jgi:hypothetical protein